jgi:hypothetical protein
VLSTEEARSLVPLYAPEVTGKSEQQLDAYQRMPDSVLFRVQRVQVGISEFDLPGPTRRKVFCSRCGQVVRDHREAVVDGLTLCRPCADGAYFTNAREVTWPDMNWAPNQSDQLSAVSYQASAQSPTVGGSRTAFACGLKIGPSSLEDLGLRSIEAKGQN